MAYVPENVVEKAEDITDKILKTCNTYLPTASRLCLISTFLEDGLRMYFQWTLQIRYIDTTWNCGTLMAILFVLFNLVGELGGCVLILLQKRVQVACAVLLSTIFLQVVAYSFMSNFHIMIRTLALMGSLLLILADCAAVPRSLLAGVPSLGDNKTNYMKLTGRCLIALMYITLMRFELTFFEILLELLGLVMMALVFIGYKTKLSATVLVLFLASSNFYHNAWWTIPENGFYREYARYDFFQTLSVIGGLLLIVLKGPGGVSMDELKKQW